MILAPARMKRITAVVLDGDADGVTRELLDQSVLHFVKVEHSGAALEDVAPDVDMTRARELRRRIASILQLDGSHPGPPADLDVHDLKPLDLDGATAALDKVAKEVQQVRERQRSVQQEILKLEDIGHQLDLFGNVGRGLADRERFSFLTVQSGSVPAVHLDGFSAAIRELPSVQMDLGRESSGEDGARAIVMLITMRRDDAQTGGILDRFGWIDVELPEQRLEAGEDARAELDGRLAALREEQEAAKASVSNIISKHREELQRMWAQTRMNELYARIQSSFSRTARTVVFSGWLPAEMDRRLEQAIRRVTKGRCYVEWSEARDLEPQERASVPVRLSNPGFLKPFERLVRNYSTPQYGTVDPTPLVAVAYLSMFGLMFGDAGHGLVLILVGVIGSFLWRKSGRGTSDVLRLITWCGGSAVVFGVLFGSYFGLSWFPPLWFDYHGVIAGHGGGAIRDVYGILTITIYFGIAVIGLGLVLNWVNLVSRRKWLKLVLDKGGLLGGWMYGAGVYVAGYFAARGYRELPPSGVVVAVLGIPAMILLAKAPLEFLAHRREGGATSFGALTIMDFFMEWIVEILEIFSGYLANTLSFMRVAGLGIAHVSLMIAFHEIAAMAARDGRFTFLSVVVYVLGNVLVVGLEGLSAGIQSLRLNYYEFFTKYFAGDGRAYAPVSLRSVPKEGE